MYKGDIAVTGFVPDDALLIVIVVKVLKIGSIFVMSGGGVGLLTMLSVLYGLPFNQTVVVSNETSPRETEHPHRTKYGHQMEACEVSFVW